MKAKIFLFTLFACSILGVGVRTASAQWTPLTSGTNEGLFSMYFTDANTGYAAGNNGTIIKTINIAGTLGIDEITANINSLKIYPNPSDGRFALEFTNPNKKLLKISISDITGKTVIELNCSQEQYEFGGKKLLPGVYLVKLTGDNRVRTCKMVIK